MRRAHLAVVVHLVLLTKVGLLVVFGIILSFGRLHMCNMYASDLYVTRIDADRLMQCSSLRGRLDGRCSGEGDILQRG